MPGVCIDEQPEKLSGQMREPRTATAEHPVRIDYEREQAATAAVPMFCEPLTG